MTTKQLTTTGPVRWMMTTLDPSIIEKVWVVEQKRYASREEIDQPTKEQLDK